MPVLFLLSSPKIGFGPNKREIWHGEQTKAPCRFSVQNFTFIEAEMWEYSPPKLSKFQYLAINLPLSGHSFAQFLCNSQILYTSIGSF